MLFVLMPEKVRKRRVIIGLDLLALQNNEELFNKFIFLVLVAIYLPLFLVLCNH